MFFCTCIREDKRFDVFIINFNMFSDFRMSKFTGQINKVDLFVNIRYSFEIVVNDIGVC